MKLPVILCAVVLCLVWCVCPARAGADAEAGPPFIQSLEKNSVAFVEAYNNKDLEAVLAFYDADAEIFNDLEGSVIRGMAEVREVFRQSFDLAPDRQLSVEVTSVRAITDEVVVEDGIIHFSDSRDETVHESYTYTATLVRTEAAAEVEAEGESAEKPQGQKEWRIVSSRHLKGLPQARTPLQSLDWLVNDWTSHDNQMRTEVSFQWDDGGRQIVGEALSESPEGRRLKTDIRIAWDPLRNVIRWWTFDSAGGFSEGEWVRDQENWKAQTRGVTSLGESLHVVQELRRDDDGSVLWRSSQRLLNGHLQPDVKMRLVKRPPQPVNIEL